MTGERVGETKEWHSHNYYTREDIELVVEDLRRKGFFVEFQEAGIGGNGIGFRQAYVWEDASRRRIAGDIAECSFWKVSKEISLEELSREAPNFNTNIHTWSTNRQLDGVLSLLYGSEKVTCGFKCDLV